MKTKIIILVAVFCSLMSRGQFNTFNVNFGRTNSAIRTIGLGNFAATGDFRARLHVNNFFMNSPGDATFNGFLFRTDGDQTVDNRWQLFTGTSATSQTERFRIRTFSGGFDTWLERTEVGSEADIRLLTAEVQVRARLKRLGDFCELAGPLADEVIMGDGSDVNFTALSSTNRRLFLHGTNGYLGVGSRFGENQINPNYHIHVHDSLPNFGVYQQFTNGTTLNTVSDGLRIGLNPTTSYEIRSFEPGIWFDIAQSDTIRMRFRDIDNYIGLNGSNYGQVNRIMVPLRGQDAGAQPMSMMQLGTNNAGNIARSWMNVGTTYGTNADAMYVGWMERANAGGGALQSDAIISWGCQRGPSNNSPFSDNFRILFLEPTGMNADSAGTVQGKEVFRIEPFSGNVGIGNFSQTGIHPPGNANYMGSKLDIDGDLRIRSVLQDDTLTEILVRDPNDLGRVKWRDVSTITGACEWNMVTNGTSDDLVMGYTDACNEGNTGIGINNPTAKLDVFKNVSGESIPHTGLKVQLLGGMSLNYGARIDVSASPINNSTETYGVIATSQGGRHKNFGGHFEALSISNSTSSTGIYAFATTATSGATHIGAYGSAANTKYNYGVRGNVLSNNYFTEGVGVDGLATSGHNFGTGSRYLIGVRGVADVSDDCGYRPIGVWGEVKNNTVCPSALAGYFIGNVLVTGDVTATTFTTSDENLKTNVNEISNALEIISQLRPVNYNYRVDEFPQLNLQSGLHSGFIAQEAEAIIEGITKEVSTIERYDENGNMIQDALSFRAMNYTELHAFEVAAIKELKAQVDELKLQLSSCCANSDTRSAQANDNETEFDVNLSNASIILNQNVPNPFAERTTISYSITEDFTKAQILFYDTNGKLIQSTDITTKGAGQLNVFADDLSNGIYSYALVVDGKIIDTKKMVKQ